MDQSIKEEEEEWAARASLLDGGRAFFRCQFPMTDVEAVLRNKLYLNTASTMS